MTPAGTPQRALAEADRLAECAADAAADDYAARLGSIPGCELADPDDVHWRAHLCAATAYTEYRQDVFATLARLVDRCDKARWRSAAAFAEAWLRRDAFHQLLFRVASFQYEPELDTSDLWGPDGEPLRADDDGPAEGDYDLSAADAEAEVRPVGDAAEPDELEPEPDVEDDDD